MPNALKRLARRLLPVGEVVLAPATAIAAWYLKGLRSFGLRRLPVTRRVLEQVGLLPIRHHYYEPLVYRRDLRRPLQAERSISGLDLDVNEQLALLRQFHYAEELAAIPMDRGPDGRFYYSNGAFEAGDAEFLYAIIRLRKPRRVIEIGSGYSTLMAGAAIARNRAEDPAYQCDHLCIEPYEHRWLENAGFRVVRSRVEECGFEWFETLDENDVLFIDSSHVIRPQGDVLFEFLEILGRLKRGVLVHVHDIFTPRDYPEEFMLREHYLWNEQYLLEAFLVLNRDFRVIGALNHLWHHHRDTMLEQFPALRTRGDWEPGSFWITRR